MDTVEVSEKTSLEQLLKYVGLYETGGRAKIGIQRGCVRVNGGIEKRRSYRLIDGDVVEAEGTTLKVKISS